MEKKAFIQVITNSSSYFIDYSINDFRFGHNPFYIKIGKNIFSKDFIYLDILDNKQNIKINGKIKYTNNQNIKTNTLSPNIMGPFSYLPLYNNSKIIKYIVNGNLLSITLKKNNYYLEVKSLFDKGLKLSAPVKGKMQKNIFESISANVSIILRLGNKVIFSDSSTNCGIEVVK